MMENKQTKKTPKIHELVGRILGKTQEKIYGKSKWRDSLWYRLEVEIENRYAKQIKVFKDMLETEKIWKALEQADYVGKRYLFYCSQYKGNWQLVNWKELDNSSVNNKQNHGSN